MKLGISLELVGLLSVKLGMVIGATGLTSFMLFLMSLEIKGHSSMN